MKQKKKISLNNESEILHTNVPLIVHQLREIQAKKEF
jgi:hypothetical protein